MYFENLTMVPFDWDAIDRKYMTDRDISLLNEYHSEVYKRISPYLDEDEKAWLREKTMPR
jgi:Xaa-Pro aminopeptidase